jgi:serine/threonine protein kinase
LIHIHSKNIIHKDIKPENVIIDDLGFPRIADFGIARFNVLENSNETSGTPGYMGIILIIFSF